MIVMAVTMAMMAQVTKIQVKAVHDDDDYDNDDSYGDGDGKTYNTDRCRQPVLQVS